jgi:hypothetical protein
MTAAEIAVLKSLSHQLLGEPDKAPPLTLPQYEAVVVALRERGLLGTQEQTVQNDWTGRPRSFINAVWLTQQGRQAVQEL